MSNSKAVVPSLQNQPDEALDGAEYQALETALLQSARGRAFLSQYLQANGGGAGAVIASQDGVLTGADTDRILQAVNNLHETILNNQQAASSGHVRMDILEMAKAISKTRAEISSMKSDGDYDHLSVASEEMDAIVLSTEKATNDILQAAEKIQEVAWRLREAGASDNECEAIDNHATDIYMACSFQDITGQRTTKVVRVLQYLEARINSMIEIWGIDLASVTGPQESGAQAGADAGAADSARIIAPSADERPDAHLLNGPQMEDLALGQDNIDALMGGNFASNEEMPAAAQELGEVMAGDMPEEVETAEDVLDQQMQQVEAASVADEGSADHNEPADKIITADEIIDEEKLKALFS